MLNIEGNVELSNSDKERVAKDRLTIDGLRAIGDQKDVVREIDHMSVFPSEETATLFADWVKNDENELIFSDIERKGKEYDVHFSHHGTTNYDDLTQHTVIINRKSQECGGTYIGWGRCKPCYVGL